ncbi:hypothetical protein C8A05DRAFT_39735 [Staphylotrichum tortipilum]|uniref:Uncharacterized protein n=1 Tax=Staphylotrichum tortipilum TaxID=2831512 RepID=A0AAN6M9E5_9PEZI|nr:hypothetical protein C8A05DRAFT_39735 [Staphylotrichum longicolle]
MDAESDEPQGTRPRTEPMEDCASCAASSTVASSPAEAREGPIEADNTLNPNTAAVGTAAPVSKAKKAPMNLDDLVRQHRPRPKPSLGSHRVLKASGPAGARKKTRVKAPADKPARAHKTTRKAAPAPTKTALGPPAGDIINVSDDYNDEEDVVVKIEGATATLNPAHADIAADLDRRIAALRANLAQTQTKWLNRFSQARGLAAAVPAPRPPPSRDTILSQLADTREVAEELQFYVYDLCHQIFELQERLAAVKQAEAELIVDRKDACDQFRRAVGELRQEFLGMQDWLGRLADARRG